MGRTPRRRTFEHGGLPGYAAVADPHGSLLSWTTIERAGILVDQMGAPLRRRGLGYSGYARNVLAQGQYCYALFDQRIFDIAKAEEEFVELFRYGGLKTGASRPRSRPPTASMPRR